MDTVARIGPNALLQLVPVLDRAIGPIARAALSDGAGLTVPPPDAEMWPEADVARLHRASVQDHPGAASGLLRTAGLGTGDYILENRIPGPAKALIRALPAALGARVLTMATAQHAWAFAGSGCFAVERSRPLTLRITCNPLACGSGCHWHKAVFERLYAALVWPAVTVTETSCCACGDAACRFEIARRI